MLFSKNVPLNILSCPVCGSSGYVKYRKCPECRGMSMGQMWRGKFLYWGEPLTKYHILVRKGRRVLDKFRAIGSLIFGLGFLILFFVDLYLKHLWSDVLLNEFWLQAGNFTALSFWLAISAFGYFFYRLILASREPEVVEVKGYQEKGLELGDERMLQNWQEVKKLPRRQRKNIAGVFTDEVRLILENAYFLANKYQSVEVTPVHVFYSLLSAVKVGNIFIRLGIPPQTFQAYLLKAFNKSEQKVLPIVSNDVKQILFHAYRIAVDIRQEYVNVTELLLATVNQSEKTQELLYDLKVDKQKLANVVEWLRIKERLRRQYQKFKKVAARRNKHGMDRAMTAVATPYLNNFSEDITLAAKLGYLSPCVARVQEIAEIFRVVEGGRQSVILVGDSGVGKMSIVEGIAQKMVEGDVPNRLKDKRLVGLSVSALLAGTSLSGAKERLIRIMNEIARARNIILFIKNIHELVTAAEGGSQGGVAEVLVEYLGKGNFLTLASTSTEDYNQLIVNKSIGKPFAKVEVKQMTENQSIQVLESKVGYVEYKQNVFFSYDALAQAVKLASRFLHEHNLPESAIQLITEAAAYVRNNKGEHQLITADDIGTIVSEKTGVPTTSVSENESDKLLRLEEEMHQRVIGQDEAVDLVANALRRSRAEVRSTKKPIASFLFLGPTGVGKTELAKTIASIYFGGEERMVRVDMSEYQDKLSIYRLIGQSGKQGTGILTEAVRQNPFSLVLLDEMEKADPDVLNVFLQVFDDGRLTDSVGRTIDFTNTIIIATSNAGTQYVQDQVKQGLKLEDIRQNLIKSELRQYYKPEFLNRFDGVVLFKPLDRDSIKKVASLMLKRVAKDLEVKGVELRIDSAGLEALADVGFDPEFGARPMRRAIQDKIENKLAELLLSRKLNRRDVVVVGTGAEIKVERN